MKTRKSLTLVNNDLSMRTLSFLFLSLFSSCLIGQIEQPNPFKSIGKDAKILTLSNGKYQEFFSHDTLRRIGSVMFNTITGEIESFIGEEELTSEDALRATLVSRWLSLDPLAAKYPSMSPYSFSGNSPILLIDSDGRKIKLSAAIRGDVTVRNRIVAIYAGVINENGGFNIAMQLGVNGAGELQFSNRRQRNAAQQFINGVDQALADGQKLETADLNTYTLLKMITAEDVTYETELGAPIETGGSLAAQIADGDNKKVIFDEDIIRLPETVAEGIDQSTATKIPRQQLIQDAIKKSQSLPKADLNRELTKLIPDLNDPSNDPREIKDGSQDAAGGQNNPNNPNDGSNGRPVRDRSKWKGNSIYPEGTRPPRNRNSNNQ